MLGASIGTSMKTIITKDMTRAMAAPPCPSRTMAIDTMRGAEAPKPWMKRPMRIIWKLEENRQMSEPSA